jgi:hypothetical protein
MQNIQLKDKINPSDFKATRFAGSELKNQKKEAAVRTIISMSQKNKDAWIDFKIAYYIQYCSEFDAQEAEAILDSLVQEDGILDKNNRNYSVTEEFFRVLAPFINPYDSAQEG